MATSKSPAVILVADDSAVIRHLVRLALESKGHEVIEAEDGQAALEALAGPRPDVILLDIEMPRLDGLSTLDRIRDVPALAGVPVILLTGHSDARQVVAGLERGAYDYLTKPFVPAELAARVDAAVRTIRLQDRLARRNRELDHFAAKAAHDLKTPLAVIKGGADILARAWDRLDADDRTEQLTAMARSAGRAAAMIDDLLALARFDEEDDEAPASTDVRAVIDEIIATSDLRPDEHVEVTGTFTTVVMPAADVAAAVRNLVENARHYGRSPDGMLELMITGDVRRGYQRLDIADRGPGIPEDQRAKVFDAFFTVAGSQNVNPSSTGVGLSIVRRAVERWGGHAGVEAAMPTGARLVLVIPESHA